MDLAITDNNGKELKINNLDESIKYAEESSKGQGDYWFDIHTKLTNIKEKHLKEFKDDILNVAEKYDIQNRLIYAKNHKGDTIDYEYNNNNDLIKKTTNFRNGDSTTLYNTFEKQQYTGESIKTAVKQVTKTKDGVESEEMFGDKFQYHIHEKYDNENQLLFKQTHYYNKTTTEHYYDKSTTGHWTYDNNQKELSYISFTDNVSVNNTSHNILIGGSSNNVAGKILSDKNYLYLFDKGVQDLINEFINTTDKKITPIQLEADDKLALSVLWKKEIDNPTQISNGMNKTQIEAISEKYYNLFEEDLFQNDKKRFGELIINGYENDLKQRKEQNKEFINSKQQNDMENNVNQENNMKENTTKTDEVLNIYNNLNSETKNLLKQNFWAEQERHTNWHNSDYSDTREQDKLEKLFDNANNFIKAEYKEAKEKIFNTIEYTDFYEIVINNPNLKDNVNQEQQKNNQIKDILTDIKNNNSPANNLLRREIELGAEKAFTQIGIENNLFSTKDIDDRVAEISKTQANIEADFGNLDNNQAQEFVKKAHELKNLNSFDFQKPNKQEIQAILDVFKPGETIQSIIDKYKQENSVTPQNLPVDENLQKLQDKVKYLGLGDTQEVRDKIAQIYHGDLGKSQITTTSDKVMKGNKVEFNLNFNKTEKGVFFNSYDAKLTTKQGEERSHTFNVQNNNVTSKEAINLLEGRAVKMNFQKLDTETGEITENQAFIKLKLKDEKTDKGNYKLEGYNVNSYGIGIDKIMEKSNIKGTPQELENVKKHLEKGNITSVTFQHEQKEIKGYAVFNPQWKMLNLYDEKMSRVNTNKDSQAMNMNGNEKNNVREQSQKRTL